MERLFDIDYGVRVQGGQEGSIMTYREYYETGRAVLAEAGIAEADLDARLLLEFVCHTERNTLLAHGEREVDARQGKHYRALIAERAKRIPLQHLTGVQEFMGLAFKVNEHVLIPRQDTEILVEEVLRYLHDGMSILDMCTGSGCILLSLLHYSNGCSGVGVDISEEALDVAGQNAVRILGPGFGLPDHIVFQQGDLFEQVEGKFEIIVSNPPYIESAVIHTLMPEVRLHEPVEALDGGEDGLEFYRRIISGSRRHLTGGGMLFLEIGYNQGEAVSLLMEKGGFSDVTVVKDYGGQNRVVYGTMVSGQGL